MVREIGLSEDEKRRKEISSQLLKIANMEYPGAEVKKLGDDFTCYPNAGRHEVIMVDTRSYTIHVGDADSRGFALALAQAYERDGFIKQAMEQDRVKGITVKKTYE
jgi:hypothetical protein